MVCMRFFFFFWGAAAGEDVGGPMNLVNVYSNATCLAMDGYPCYLRQYNQAKECGSRTAGVILCCTQEPMEWDRFMTSVGSCLRLII